MYDISGLNEECGVFGIWNHQEAAQLTYMGLHSLQHRGQEGAGIVCSNGENLIGERGLGLLTEAISDTQLESFKSYQHAIGMFAMLHQEIKELRIFNHFYITFMI
ncbi:amidophosphoribosyltransferase [Staphylococcus gallinarum]|uniref:Amidophosphoribosyltransferase n=1 Tax=Staphylococcus gallinarum TaxID=1293 RepID=A0A380FFS6_STAGA|nr:amidophosphoribosyltransferase [Staphylococcus gallinarum]